MTTDDQPAYFANGTEGSAWEAVWCGLCANDHGDPAAPQHDGAVCPIMLVAITGGRPTEWRQRHGAPFILPPDVVCSAFTPCTAGACHGDPHPDPRAAAIRRVDEWEAIVVASRADGLIDEDDLR